ncbi:MAG: DNA adenine methylase [Synergistaceae bacterium]|nr:DNA adenine methylase [Synergistaceae bacterium]
MPVVKWVGGKRQLLDRLLPLLPSRRIAQYCEPFVGGGAMLFSLQPNIAYVNDVNDALMGVYRVIRDDVEAIIAELGVHRNEAGYFYEVRSWDRDRERYASMSDVQKAARIIYLNRTCYNGLFRVNSAGEFNSPFGNYKNPSIVNAPLLRAVSQYLNKSGVHLSCADYAEVLGRIPGGTFVYLDPPYDPVSDTASFTGYDKGGFGREEQERLRSECDRLSGRGIRFMLSNSATDFIRGLYAAYSVTVIRARRAVNSNPAGRGEVEEVVVRNYE